MTEEELAEIETRALAAGPGAGLRASCEEPRYEPPVTDFIRHARDDEDLRFIGAARQDIPRLVEAARRT